MLAKQTLVFRLPRTSERCPLPPWEACWCPWRKRWSWSACSAATPWDGCWRTRQAVGGTPTEPGRYPPWPCSPECCGCRLPPGVWPVRCDWLMRLAFTDVIGESGIVLIWLITAIWLIWLGTSIWLISFDFIGCIDFIDLIHCIGLTGCIDLISCVDLAGFLDQLIFPARVFWMPPPPLLRQSCDYE